jgi:hypothetical protein
MIFYETKMTNNRRKETIFKAIQHRSQIMKAKHFYILAYKLKTSYKGLSHKHGILQTLGPSTEGLINLV